MPLNWTDMSCFSFNSLLLLDRCQLDWLPNWRLPEADLGTALLANPAVTWYLTHKAPEISPWLEGVLTQGDSGANAEAVRAAEVRVMTAMQDIIIYVTDPAIYAAQPFLDWEPSELTGLLDFHGKMVVDVGSGTGRQAFAVASAVAWVYAVEPVANLRDYLRAEADRRGLRSFYVVDGLITRLPFPDSTADVTMGGHVFGDEPEAEISEMERVTRRGGWVILCPGNNDVDDERHAFLIKRGYSWSRFEEPRDGMKRKYWKRI
jgi:SAM-dependent methyltransferase